MTRVLVISSSETLGVSLSRLLPPGGYRVSAVRPGSGVLPALQSERPEVAVVDGIDERPEGAQLEIALAKAYCPEARVIVLTGNSSPADAPVLEAGVFYYMAAPTEGELARVVRTAAGEETALEARP